jgi:hypothetical protein
MNRTENLFETDPFLEIARAQSFWIACALSTAVYGYNCTKRKTIRSPMFVGFLLFTAEINRFCTIEATDPTSAIVFSGLSCIGFGAPLISIIAGVQLSTPYHLSATATAVTMSTRAVAATTFTAIYTAAPNTRLDKYIPSYVAKAAVGADLAPTSLPVLVMALTSQDTAALSQIPGVTPEIIGANVTALRQAFADDIRVVFIIAAPFGALACIVWFLLGSLKDVMNYHVGPPIELCRVEHREVEALAE